MASNWPTAKLGDVVDLFDSQRVPLNSRQRQERRGKFPYYGAQGIIDHIDGYIFDGRYILVAEDGENLNSKKLPLALFATGKFWVNNHAHILRGKPSIADDTFLLACLNNADIKPNTDAMIMLFFASISSRFFKRYQELTQMINKAATT